MIISDAMRADVRLFITSKLQNKEKARVVVIKTPYSLDEKEKQWFKKLLGGSVTIENKIDKELLGGFIVHDGSTMLDGSIKGSLNTIVSSLLTR